MFCFWKRRSVQPRGPGFEIDLGLLSDLGCCREHNEDSGAAVRPADPGLLSAKGVLLVVADGMGGHQSGEVASRTAVQAVRRAFYTSREEPGSALAAAFRQANRELYALGRSCEDYHGMGTTCTALALAGGFAYSAHVGDSRIYLVRDRSIYQMSEDHSAVMDLVKRGLLTLAEARRHEDRNVILRALGSRPEVDVSTWGEPFPLRAGDRFVLSSDGLHDPVTEDEILRAVLAEEPQAACEVLVALARQRGGYDNITIGVARVRTAGRPAPAHRTCPVEVAE